ncbi:MAG: hypothetical protein CMJ18_10740 [Phycisphaeraceae bacterium]|nr:hypothetical protein [Phycisphaeraceae bacterium]
MKYSSPAIALLLLASLTSAQAEELTTAQIEALCDLTPQFETPHTKWARPLAHGPVRVLFITQIGTNINALPLRRPVEIIQRFDVEAEAVLTTLDGVHGGEAGAERLVRLLRARPDCFVLQSSSLEQLDEEARYVLIEQVRTGAGLLIVNKPESGLPEGMKALDTPPAFLADITAETYMLGEGRVLVFTHQAGFNLYRVTSEQKILGIELLRDEHFERLGRAMLWTARREPKSTLAISMSADRFEHVDTGEPTSHVRVTHVAAAPIDGITLETRIRNLGNASQSFSDAVRVEPNGNRFAIPKLPSGAYRFDVIARSRRGIEAWATQPFSVTAPQQVTSIKLDREWGTPGTPIEGTVTIRGSDPHMIELRVQAVDAHSRVVAQQHRALSGTEMRFSLPTSEDTPGYVAVKASLWMRDREVSAGYTEPYTIPRSRLDQWNYILWGRLYAHQHLDLAEYIVVDSGVTSRMETTYVAWWYMSRLGLNYSPMVPSGTYRPPDTGPQVPQCNPDGTLKADGCWNDEPAVSKRLEDYVRQQQGFRAHGVLIYDMGDEQATRGSCLHPTCWKVYLDWLRGQYHGDIAALNASWGTAFAGFEEIQPVIDETAVSWVREPQRAAQRKTIANNEGASVEAPKGSTTWTEAQISYPRWFDRRAFQFQNFANYVGRYTEATRRADPEAVCGVEGTFEDLDQDIDAIVEQMGYWMPYAWREGGWPNEVIRCITPRSYRHGNFIGMVNFWPTFMRGANTVGKWRIDNLLNQQMGLTDSYRRMTESARIVFDGLGTLLNVHEDTRMLHDGVLMLHSFTSFQAIKLQAGPSYGLAKARDEDGGWNPPGAIAHRRSHKIWHRTIRSCGLQFDYVTDRQIERGQFDPSPYRVLILSQCEAIGPEQERFIRAFVAAGGTVIADVRPGLYGARCKPRQDGVLDDLFGVRHTGNVESLVAPGRIAATIGARDFAIEALDMRVNPAVQTAGGRALGRAGEHPICIVNDVGSGRAILLNFPIWSYPNTALHDESHEAADFISALFEAAGVARPLDVVDSSGRRHRNIEAMRWRTGDGLQVVALHGPDRDTWPDVYPPVAPLPFDGLDDPVEVTVNLPRAMHVTEMRTGTNLGRTRRFTTGVRPWWATLLVLSEKKIESPELRATAESVSQRDAIDIDLRIPDAQGTHAIKVRVTAPNGDAARWFDRSVIVEDGAARFRLPIAHNEQPGTWTVTAKDLYTEQTARSAFRVREPPQPPLGKGGL